MLLKDQNSNIFLPENHITNNREIICVNFDWFMCQSMDNSGVFLKMVPLEKTIEKDTTDISIPLAVISGNELVVVIL